jgi:putative inorganic carbon (HCO3(-)) transporter
MPNEQLAELAAVAGALGAVAVLLARSRLPLVAGFAALAAAEAGLVWARVPREDLERLATPAAAGALVAGTLAVAALAAVLVRRPELVPLLVLVAAPFRLPVDLGAQSALLLVPLYAALAAAALALVYRALRDGDVAPIPRVLALPAAAFVALAAVSLLWALDPKQGTVQLLFFLFPGAVLVAVVARAPFARWLPRALAVSLVALTTVFALVGLWQLRSGNLFFARDVEVANEFSSYVRVTSLFADPSIYGRHLVLGIGVVLVALWLGRIHVLAAGALVALLWAGLFVSYSQSSMVTLVVVTLVVTLVLADRRSRVVVAVALATATVVAGAATAAVARDHSLREVTSGRSRLVETTARVIAKHPLAGVGIGSQPAASREEAEGATQIRRNASHTTPLTIAAELGALGVATYLSFLAGAAWLLSRAFRHDAALGVGLGAVFLALAVHSLFYSGFFEDPLTWGVPAFAAAVLGAHRAEPVADAQPTPTSTGADGAEALPAASRAMRVSR